MVKWVCELCGYVHQWPCKPGCENFRRYGSCAPKTCQGCGATCNRENMHLG